MSQAIAVASQASRVTSHAFGVSSRRVTSLESESLLLTRDARPETRDPRQIYLRPPTRDPGPRERGFTLFELAVVIVVVSVAGTVFLDRLRFYQEVAEKAAMESTLRLIKTGLQIKLAELIVTNRQAEAPKLESEDPIRWLDDKPPNYGGNYREPPARGAWYFDTRQRELVYVVSTGERLETEAGRDAKELRFQAQLLKDRLTIGGTTLDSVTGVTLKPVTRYRWSRSETTYPLT